MTDEIPLCRPSISEEEIAAVADVLRSGWLAHGPLNHKFEELFAKTIGVPHAIAMNSCTSALEVALKIAGIRGEVVTPPARAPLTTPEIEPSSVAWTCPQASSDRTDQIAAPPDKPWTGESQNAGL